MKNIIFYNYEGKLADINYENVYKVLELECRKIIIIINFYLQILYIFLPSSFTTSCLPARARVILFFVKLQICWLVHEAQKGQEGHT